MVIIDDETPDPPGPRETFSPSGPGLISNMPTRTTDDFGVEMRMALEDIRDRARAGINLAADASDSPVGADAAWLVATLRGILDQIAVVEKRWWSGR